MINKGKFRRFAFSVLMAASLLAAALLASGPVLAQESQPSPAPPEALPAEDPTSTPTAEPTLPPEEQPTTEPTPEPVLPPEEPAQGPTEEWVDGSTQTPTPELTPTEIPEELAPLEIPKGGKIVNDRYIVVYREGIAASKNRNAIGALVGSKGGRVKHFYSTVLNGFSAFLPPEALKAVRANPAVKFVEADTVVSVNDEPAASTGMGAQVTQSGATWGLDRVDQHDLPLDDQYFYSTTASSVHVYLIDTGIRSTHVEFGGRAAKEYDSVGDGQNGNDCNGHGTHVAGTIGGVTYGIAKGVAIHAVRVLDCAGNGSASDAIAGLEWVANNRILPAVANLSLAGGASSTLDSAVKKLISINVTVVTAAGNSTADACNFSPARIPDAITVGATTSSDARSSFSNYGSCLDLFAPGSSITSANNTSDTATAIMNGTSMAAPHVAGTAALYLQTNPNASPLAVASAIRSVATTAKVTDVKGSSNRLLYSLVGYTGPAIPEALSPSGVYTERYHTYRWTQVASASKYQFQVFRNGSMVIDKTISAPTCGSGICSYSPSTSHKDGSYTWKVRANVGGTWSAYSLVKAFYVSNPFTASFNGSMSGFAIKAGAAWSTNSTSLYTAGLQNYWTSAYRKNKVYNNFTFSARVKRESDLPAENCLVVRGGSSRDPDNYAWFPGYAFCYANNGNYIIYRANANGNYTLLKDWTAASAIIPFQWNVLKVAVNGTNFSYFINDEMIQSFQDSAFTQGYVGFQMYRGITSGRFLADWATLNIP